jgi:hypothetical protein
MSSNDKEYINRNGLLVPADISNAASLRGHLSAERDFSAVANEDEWLRLAQVAEQDMRLADISELASRAKRSRKSRQRDADEADKLAELYRSAKASGARAKIRASILDSAENRALRLDKLRKGVLIVGLPVLTGLGLWSATGVQAGFAKMLGLTEGDPMWWAAWLVEPSLIAIVAGIIVARSILKTSGGNDDHRAYLAEGATLLTSIGLNMYGGWDASGWDGFGHAVTHSIGPIFTALVAFLIGLYISYATQADPWKGASRIDELGLADDPMLRRESDPGPRQLPETHLPELPGDAPPSGARDASAQRPDRTSDAAASRRLGARRTGPGARRAPSASTGLTSGDAPNTDPATRAAHLVLTRGLSNRKAASEVGGTSEASVRRRVKEIRESGAPDAPSDADYDPEGEAAERVTVAPLNLPLPDSAASVTHGLNGHRPAFAEEVS